MNETSETAHAGSCPICGRRAVKELRPFCSRRCADIDLHRWLGGVYAVPVTEETDEDGAPGSGGKDDHTS
jgi:endogenous inhibitor of DNA gyrase (YacG/DUF329 family)